MRKRTYRAVNVKDVDFEKLAGVVEGLRIAVGVDVAKEDFFAVLMDEKRHSLLTLKWKHPVETRRFVALLEGLPANSLEVSMEPSGTYGDPLRHLLYASGIPVFKVSPKRIHDAKEVYDGVPSKHDSKDASIIARFHLDGLSSPWVVEKDQVRDFRGAVSTLDLFKHQQQQNLNRLESMPARHWPEAPSLLSTDSMTLLVLLREFGGPGGVAGCADKARKLMHRTANGYLSPEKIDSVIDSARLTVGVSPTAGEQEFLRVLCKELVRTRKEISKANKKVERLADQHAPVSSMGAVVGKATAAVLFANMGDPRDYDNAASYEKAAGLNLVEHSSGKHRGQKRISRRGSSTVRRWLFPAALRLIRKDPVIRAWHRRKIERDGGKKILSVVAIMRKIIRALWYVAQGEVFDSTLLFNVNRLKLRDV